VELPTIADRLRYEVNHIRFTKPVTYVYNPLDYAWEPHARYLERYGRGRKEVVLLGMNPGPWGMAQTGVPFGEVGFVRDWLRIEGPVGKPKREHLKRPVTGFACHRSEVSGARLWGWAKENFATPRRFFSRFFVANYCPLMFMETTGRNRTPDKLLLIEREPLFAACDLALRRSHDMSWASATLPSPAPVRSLVVWTSSSAASCTPAPPAPPPTAIGPPKRPLNWPIWASTSARLPTDSGWLRLASATIC
jgi:single-strand selective monofunctional uracil DNA glycosylase